MILHLRSNTMIRRIRILWRKHYLLLELLTVIVAASTATRWAISLDGTSAIYPFLHSNWENVYQTTASIAVVLLGFSLATISLVGGYVSKPEFTVLRESKPYAVLWRTIFSSVRYLGCLAIWSLCCLVIDRDDDPVLWIKSVFLFLVMISIIRVIRSVWITKNIVSIETGTSL